MNQSFSSFRKWILDSVSWCQRCVLPAPALLFHSSEFILDSTCFLVVDYCQLLKMTVRLLNRRPPTLHQNIGIPPGRRNDASCHRIWSRRFRSRYFESSFLPTSTSKLPRLPTQIIRDLWHQICSRPQVAGQDNSCHPFYYSPITSFVFWFC